MFNTIIKEIRELWKDKRIWIGILAVLIIIIIGTSYNRKKPEQQPSDMLKMGVINNDDSSYSELLLSYFNGSETFSSLINVSVGESDEMKASFHRGNLDIYIEIPEGFAQNMIQIEHIPIKVTINIKDTTKAILFQNILQSYEKYISAVEVNAVGLYDIMQQDGMDQKLIDEMNTKISMDLIFTALGKEAFFSFHEVDTFPATKIMDYYMVAILVMSLMYAGLYAGFRLLTEMKQGTFTRLMTTQMSLYRFLTAKILFLTIILGSFAIFSICMIKNSRPTGSIIFFGLSVTFFCVIFSVFLSAFFYTTQRFVLVGNLLIFYFAVIGGGIIPIMYLPQDIIAMSKITPVYYLMEGIIRLEQKQSVSLHTGLILSLASLLCFCITIVRFTGRRGLYGEV